MRKRDWKNAQWQFVRAFFDIPIRRLSRKRLRKWRRHKRRASQNRSAFVYLDEIKTISPDEYARLHESLLWK